MTQTYPLLAAIDPPIVATMAQTGRLRVVEQTATRITLEGHEDDLAVFADRLAMLTRLCR